MEKYRYAHEKNEHMKPEQAPSLIRKPLVQKSHAPLRARLQAAK
jgi:hypothetical protein